MSCWQQYEVWELRGTAWERVASFAELAPAAALASLRSRGVQMFLATYEEGRLAAQEFYVRIGELRGQAVPNEPPAPKKRLWRR
jgi:hypothetical protein